MPAPIPIDDLPPEQRKGRIMAMLANTINAIEREVDRPDGIGVPADAIEELNEACATLLTPWHLDGLTNDARAAYSEAFDKRLSGE